MTTISFFIGRIVAKGTVEKMMNMPEFEIGESKPQLVPDIGNEVQLREPSNDHDNVNAQKLLGTKEDRQVGSVSLKVNAKYFTHGAPVFVLLLILLTAGIGKGKSKIVSKATNFVDQIVLEFCFFITLLLKFFMSLLIFYSTKLSLKSKLLFSYLCLRGGLFLRRVFLRKIKWNLKT